MPKLFLSFRRGDSTDLARKIRDRLLGYYKIDFGVVDDIGYISATADVTVTIRERIRTYNVLLVVMGSNWLNITNRSGQRRIELPDDPIRLEIQAALSLAIPIVVILIQPANLPSHSSLPAGIQGLASLSQNDIIPFRGETTFNADMRRLYKVLSDKIETIEHPTTPEVPDRSAPEFERQKELRAFRDRGTLPPGGLEIRSLGEIEYLKLRSGPLNGSSARPLNLQNVSLKYINIDGADLNGANLTGADLRNSRMRGCQLEGADLTGANLEGADLSQANFKKARLNSLDLTNTLLQGAVDLGEARLEKAILRGMDLTGISMNGAYLAKADLSSADLRGVDLTEAILENAALEYADLTGANLTNANLTGARLTGTNFSGAKLDGAAFSSIGALNEFIVDGKANLSAAAWGGISARQGREPKSRLDRIAAFRDSARINYLIADTLTKRGMLTESSDYRLRAQRAQRKILFLQGQLGAWLFSWALNLLSGYGERPVRALISYFVTVAAFAFIYFFGPASGLTNTQPTTILQSLVLSFAAFHGSGLLPASLNLTDPLSAVAAIESLIGLFIELIFIATFSRRFFGS